MVSIFGVNFEKYSQGIDLKEPVLNIEPDDGMLNLKRNLQKQDSYEIKLSEVISFRGIEEKCMLNDRGYKKMIRYDQHLERIESLGLDRSISLREFLAFLTNMYRNELYSSEIEELLKNIIKGSTGEFLCDAVQKSGDRLIYYEEVKDIKYDSKKEIYLESEEEGWFRNKHLLNIDETTKEGFYDINYFIQKLPNILEFLFGVQCEKIPFSLKYGKDRIVIQIPESGSLYPLSIGGGNGYNILCPEKAGSRGVRKK